MVFVGIVTTLVGWLIAVSSLTVASSSGGRLGVVLAGIVVSLARILGRNQPSLPQERDLEAMRGQMP
jgi:hypothetical protein